MTTEQKSISHSGFSRRSGPAEVGLSLLRNRELIHQMVIRDVVGRYRGSFFGILWTFVHPLLMLAVYTFVLGYCLKSRWPGTNSDLEYALVLFSGLILFNFWAECLSRAPSLVLANPNYVKKVVFPLEILSWTAVLSALVHTAISLLAWIAFRLIVTGSLHWTMLYIPLFLLPLGLIALGCSWFLSSLGVYVRDVGHLMGVIVQAMMFLSPLFYRIDSTPPLFQKVLMFNPLTYVVEAARGAMIYGQAPSLGGLAIYWLISFVVAWLGLFWFQHTRDGFADVI